MAGISHFFGNDISLGSNGDLQGASGLTYSQQRILRRLLTNPGDYIWDPTYGAGLPKRVGMPYTIAELTGLIRSQMYLEPSVAHTPEPDISITKISDGVSVQIIYTDAESQDTAVLNFSV